MRTFPVALISFLMTAAIGISTAHADEDGWRRHHEWREHHWRAEQRERYGWPRPSYVYVEPPPVYYRPPPTYYQPAPFEFSHGAIGFTIGQDEDDE